MHTLPDLPYNYDALEPHIDERTMKIHHTKHHWGYVEKLNTALEGHAELAKKSVEDLLVGIAALPQEIQESVRNNGGGHANHSLFWKSMSPSSTDSNQAGGGKPDGDLAGAIDDVFSGFDNFKQQFSQAAGSVFGSGWVWLVRDRDANLKITTSANQDSPLINNQLPLLGLDVWEHAYYLNYQNKRVEYIEAFWNIVHWQAVNQRFRAYTK